ncbi:MAG: NAD(P)/FAD-dependent oxidoreductase [Nitritalea sp.]
MHEVIVIGAGAAGYFAAIHAAAAGAEVLLLEKTRKTLAKVKVSGGGRCNVTHAAFQSGQLLKNYPRGERFLKKVVARFQVQDTIDWFSQRGVALKVEADGRMFPTTDSSQSIIDCLRTEASRQGVVLLTEGQVTSLRPVAERWELQLPDKVLQAQCVIICTGGASKRSQLDWLANLNLEIVNPVPSLFTFNGPDEPLRQLPGISVPEASVRLENTKWSYSGPLLLTHWGLSGPAVLKLSAFAARHLADMQYQGVAQIRWVAEFTEEQLQELWRSQIALHPKMQVKNSAAFPVPQRLWHFLLEQAEIALQTPWQEVSKKQKNKLTALCFAYPFQLRGKTTFKEEFVTAGGISLSEVDPLRMEARRYPGLFFAGEVLDIDGITGGFNFQAAWSTGFVAGSEAGQAVAAAKIPIND